MRRTTKGLLTRVMLVSASAVLACQSDTTPSPPAGDNATAGPSGEMVPAGGEAAPSPSTPEPTPEPETYTPGELGVRVVNLLAENVDTYVRTTGRVRAFEVQTGVTPATVTAFYNPPAGGKLVVTRAGAGDATCVVRCDHFVADLTPQPDQGNAHTLILYDEAGRASTMDLWENPAPERQTGYANAMAPPDAARGLFVVTAVAVRDAQFGLRLGFEGTAGCQEPVNSTNVLVGGNQTPAFAHAPGAVNVLLYDSQDRSCAGPAVGGPFMVTAAAGARNHLILSGTPNAMQGLVIPMMGAAAATNTVPAEPPAGP